MDMQNYLVGRLTEVKEKAEREVKNANQCLRQLEKTGLVKIAYRVNIVSNWVTEGEQEVEAEHYLLPTAIEIACKAFKRINSRSDIQGRINVSAVIGGLSIWIPSDLFEEVKTGSSTVGFKLKEDEQCVRMADESTD
jgi:hypothetical protein